MYPHIHERVTGPVFYTQRHDMRKMHLSDSIDVYLTDVKTDVLL